MEELVGIADIMLYHRRLKTVVQKSSFPASKEVPSGNRAFRTGTDCQRKWRFHMTKYLPLVATRKKGGINFSTGGRPPLLRA